MVAKVKAKKHDKQPKGKAHGSRLYSLDDGRHIVVRVDEYEPPEGSRFRYHRQPTTITVTDEKGRSTSAPDWEFPPGTSHENAVLEAGFTIGEPDA